MWPLALSKSAILPALAATNVAGTSGSGPDVGDAAATGDDADALGPAEASAPTGLSREPQALTQATVSVMPTQTRRFTVPPCSRTLRRRSPYAGCLVNVDIQDSSSVGTVRCCVGADTAYADDCAHGAG